MIRGTNILLRNFFKNALIAILTAYFVATAVPWLNTRGAICGAFIAAELVMYFLTAYDEITRQRDRKRASRKGQYREAE